MEKKIKQLYEKLGKIVIFYLIYQKRDNIEQTKKLVPEIKEFVMWFLKDNPLHADEKQFQVMSKELIDILKDLLESFEHKDMVLLHDTIAYGLMDYLELFLNNRKEITSGDNL